MILNFNCFGRLNFLLVKCATPRLSSVNSYWSHQLILYLPEVVNNQLGIRILVKFELTFLVRNSSTTIRVNHRLREWLIRPCRLICKLLLSRLVGSFYKLGAFPEFDFILFSTNHSCSWLSDSSSDSLYTTAEKGITVLIWKHFFHNGIRLSWEHFFIQE